MGVTIECLPAPVLLLKDAVQFSERLSKVIEAQYDTSVQWAELLSAELLDHEYRHIMAYAAKQNINTTNKAGLTDLLKQIQAQLRGLPTIDIQLAFLPRYVFTRQLVDWFSQYGPGPGCLAIKVRPACLGGIIIGYNGKIYDYSLSKQFKEAHGKKLRILPE